jgi:hypothetical protein
MNINTNLALNECTGLNIEGYDSVREIFGSGGTIKSNKGDPELIIIVKFLSPTNISGIKLNGGMDSEKNPENMGLYVNNANLSFSDIDSCKPAELINLSEKIGKNIPLKIAKFRNVQTLAVNLFKIDSFE